MTDHKKRIHDIFNDGIKFDPDGEAYPDHNKTLSRVPSSELKSLDQLKEGS